MSNGTAANTTVTPEAVAISLEVAGLCSRMVASLFDSLIQGAIVVSVILAFSPLGGTLQLIVYSLVTFLVLWAYYPLFEGLWNGRTPGKRFLRLRVIRSDGQPINAAAALIRNILRIVDFLPAYYAVGAVFVVLTSRSQRLGDLAAGTVVVRERKVAPPAPLQLDEGAGRGPSPMDTTAMTEAEYGLIRSLLERRDSLDPAARAAVASRVAAAVRPKVAGHDGMVDDERFLYEVAVAYRRRFEEPGSLRAQGSVSDSGPS